MRLTKTQLADILRDSIREMLTEGPLDNEDDFATTDLAEPDDDETLDFEDPTISSPFPSTKRTYGAEDKPKSIAKGPQQNDVVEINPQYLDFIWEHRFKKLLDNIRGKVAEREGDKLIVNWSLETVDKPTAGLFRVLGLAGNLPLDAVIRKEAPKTDRSKTGGKALGSMADTEDDDTLA